MEAERRQAGVRACGKAATAPIIITWAFIEINCKETYTQAHSSSRKPLSPHRPDAATQS